MKVLYTILLLVIITLISSCKSQDQKLAEYYRDINDQMKGENYPGQSNTRTRYTDPNKDSKSINYSAESAYMAQVKSKYEHYKVKYDELEYANEDIYAEATKRRQALIDRASKNCSDCRKKADAAATPVTQSAAPGTTTRPPAANTASIPPSPATTTTSEQRSTPDFFAHLLDADKKLVGTEGISYVNATEDRSKLKKYNTIIASLARYEGVERLQKAFDGQESLTIVRNDAGLYYVIIGGYDTKEQAIEKRRTVESTYRSKYTSAQLQKTYGIPFTDLWILRK
jgi:cell division protein FtsN